MKKFNLFKEIITVDKRQLLQAINSTKLFGINTKGEVLHKPFKENEILIYEGEHKAEVTNALTSPKLPSLTEILGKNYQIVEDGDRVLIKAFSNWQELIKVNTLRASYDDTTADGVDEFANKKLEDLGWQATEFDITYRVLVEILEEKVEGTLLCIEQENPYQFSGLGFLDNNKEAYDILYNYCQIKIKDLLANNSGYAKAILTDDQEEAIKFFQSL